MIHTATSTLIDELQQQGFIEGTPAHLSAELLMADLQSYSRMACEQCGKRTQRVLPFYRGEDYAIVIVCHACGNAVEM